MKQRIIILLLLIGVVAVLCVIPLNGSNLWYTVKINEAGPADTGLVYFRITDVDGSFTSKWYKAPEGQEDRMLAVALTAISSDKYVRVNLSAMDEYSTITRMYVLNQLGE